MANAAACGCKISGPLGVSVVLTDHVVYRNIGGDYYALSPCALHGAARETLAALDDLRAACREAYAAGRIPAEPFVRAGNAIADARRSPASRLGRFALNMPEGS